MRIEPVKPDDYARALCLLTGEPGGRGARSAAFDSILRGGAGGRFWWVRTFRGPVAAALSIPSPGNTSMIFHTSPAENQNAQPLVRLLAELGQEDLRQGTRFVQAMVGPFAIRDAEALRQAGYEFLATLIYMARPIAGEIAPGRHDGEISWQSFNGDDSALTSVIADTYVDSLDCPAMLGLRNMSEVIACHRAGGVYRPEQWLIPTLNDAPVGCILLNDSHAESAGDVVYLGIRPAWRGKGLGTTLLRHAINLAARRGLKHLRLAVDAANPPAVRLYTSHGFIETDRRDIYLLAVRPLAHRPATS